MHLGHRTVQGSNWCPRCPGGLWAVDCGLWAPGCVGCGRWTSKRQLSYSTYLGRYIVQSRYQGYGGPHRSMRRRAKYVCCTLVPPRSLLANDGTLSCRSNLICLDWPFVSRRNINQSVCIYLPTYLSKSYTEHGAEDARYLHLTSLGRQTLLVRIRRVRMYHPLKVCRQWW